MAMAGIDLPTLKEIAGHAQVSVSMTYVSPTQEHKRRAVDKIEKFKQEEPPSSPGAEGGSGSLPAGFELWMYNAPRFSSIASTS